MDKLTVGELAERTQTTRRALRLYEQIGILTPDREPNGYRVYTEKHVEQALFIKGMRAIGRSLKELVEFYEIKRSDLPREEKRRKIMAMIDRAHDHLVGQRAAIDAALDQLEVYRQDFEILMPKAKAEECATDNDAGLVSIQKAIGRQE